MFKKCTLNPCLQRGGFWEVGGIDEVNLFIYLLSKFWVVKRNLSSTLGTFKAPSDVKS